MTNCNIASTVPTMPMMPATFAKTSSPNSHSTPAATSAPNVMMPYPRINCRRRTHGLSHQWTSRIVHRAEWSASIRGASPAARSPSLVSVQSGERRMPGYRHPVVTPSHRLDADTPTRSGQSWGGRRSCLTSVRRFFAFRRRSLAPRPGVVGRRDGEGGRRASATSAASRARAASLLRNCARCSDAVIVSTPSTRRPLRRSRSRSRWSGERTAEAAASHTSSTRESAVFTPCPPGPEDRENRHDSSESGMVILESTRRPGRWAAGMHPSSSCYRGCFFSSCASITMMPLGPRTYVSL